jgi:hypothetical protein
MAIIVGQRIVDISNSNAVGIASTYFTIHTFSTPGTTSFTPKGSGYVDVFLVGGGGGSGGPSVCGGGGGSVLFYKNIPLIDGVSYPITVGAAGAGTVGNPTIFNYNGGQIVAPGGGQGGNASGAKNNPLGCGGGGNGPTGAGIGAGIIGFGFPGSGSSSPSFNGGAGGGAAGPGTPAPGGQGGPGIQYSITGVSTFYGGGGGGTPGNLDPNSFPTMIGLGAGSGPIPATPGVIIVRYISR